MIAFILNLISFSLYLLRDDLFLPRGVSEYESWSLTYVKSGYILDIIHYRLLNIFFISYYKYFINIKIESSNGKQ